MRKATTIAFFKNCASSIVALAHIHSTRRETINQTVWQAWGSQNNGASERSGSLTDRGHVMHQSLLLQSGEGRLARDEGGGGPTSGLILSRMLDAALCVGAPLCRRLTA